MNSIRGNSSDYPDYSNLFSTLRRQGYHIVGKHSAVKRCKWYRESLLDNGECYKARFYGIKSHLCMQSTPSLQFCTQSCLFCWRIMEDELETKDGKAEKAHSRETPDSTFDWDSPETVLDGLIREQKRFAEGYKGNPKANKKKVEEAFSPKLLTLSLAGEPTIYPYLGELIALAHKRGFLTFLVTNGTLPERLESLKSLPTQLYVSFDASNKMMYDKTCRPAHKGLWDKYMQTLKFISSVKGKTRTVLRMTLVKGYNFEDADGYAELIKIAQPDYVEVKSFVFVGGARNEKRGLALANMITMDEIREFAKRLAELTDYKYTDEHIPSRVALLCRDETAVRKRKIS